MIAIGVRVCGRAFVLMDIIADIQLNNIEIMVNIHLPKPVSIFYDYFIRNAEIICRMQISAVFTHNFIDTN